MVVCAACGQENPEEARFCLACGASLAAPEAPRELRKTVTVLFCDVTGSTALGEKVDPESLRRLMARYFEEMKRILERHGASVEKFIGDAVMAVFGVPQLHEDDALRAVRAAVEMRAALPGLGLEARIGVNTGEVVTGTEERLVTGDAVNVAARLEQAAGPGEIFLGDATRRLVRDAVDVERVDPLAVKGKSAAVAAWRLVSVLEGAPAFERRLDSPLVGRARERETLRQAFDRAAGERACHLFTVLGTAGVGKSRLVREVLESIGDEARVVSGRCLSYGEGISERIRGAVGLGEASAAAPEETFWAVRKLFESLALERPLVVVFDDVQWAEPTFLDLVDHLADWSRDAPILVVCLARPELLDARPAWGGGKLNATSILLEPLSEDESAELIGNLIGQNGLDEAVRARIVEAAEGNPLFVEEMLAMVAEDGRDGEIEVPPTISALLAARLDRLDTRERGVIERAAVEGKVFHRGAVAELSPAEVRGEVSANLMRLVRKELIRPDRPDFPGEDAFRFRSLLVRDAAYQGLPKEARAELHERFAEWLERMAGERAGEYEEIVGYHLEQAYRFRAELGPLDERAHELGRHAAERLAAPGRQAHVGGDVAAACNLLERAAALGGDDPALLVDLGASLGQAGELARAEDVLRKAIERAAAAEETVLEARAQIERLTLLQLSDPEGRTDVAQAEAERLIPALEKTGDDLALAKAWRLLAWVHLMRCRFAEMGRVVERALEHAERAGDQREQGELFFWLPAAAVWGPTPAADGIRLCEELRARARGFPLREAGVEGALGLFKAMAGEAEEAHRLRARSRAIYLELGMRLHLAAYSMDRAWTEVYLGTPENAEEELREALDTLEQMGERSYRSTVAATLAQVLCMLGRYDEAEPYTELSEELAAKEDAVSQIMWRGKRAQVLARRGDLERAEALARDAVAMARQTDAPDWIGEALLDLADVLRLAGHDGESKEFAEEAAEIYERKGIVRSAERARALLG